MDSPGSSQMVEMQGILRLACPGLPDLGCLLIELRPDGCRASVMFPFLPATVVTPWRAYLVPDNPVRAKIESHPTLGSMELDSLVVRAVETRHHCEIELCFHQPTPGQRAMLMQLPPPRAAAAASPFEDAVEFAPVPPPAAIPAPAPTATPAPGPSPQSIPGPAAVAFPDRRAQRKLIGTVLMQMGKLSSQDVETAAAQARASGERLGQYLIRTGRVSASALCRALALQSGLPMTDLAAAEITPKIQALFPSDILLRYEIVPFDDAGMFVCVAASSPLPPSVARDLERVCHRKVEVFLAREDQVRQFLQAIKPKQPAVPRKHIRYDTSVPVTYQFCSRFGEMTDATVYEGMAVNISEGGFSIDGPALNLKQPDDLMRVGMCMALVVNPQAPQELRVLCRLKLIQPKGSRWTLNVEMLQASADDHRRLKELCVQVLRAQSKPPPAV